MNMTNVTHVFNSTLAAVIDNHDHHSEDHADHGHDGHMHGAEAHVGIADAFYPAWNVSIVVENVAMLILFARILYNSKLGFLHKESLQPFCGFFSSAHFTTVAFYVIHLTASIFNLLDNTFWPNFVLTDEWCLAAVVLRTGFYVIGKILVYSFFEQRLHTAFDGSVFAVSSNFRKLFIMGCVAYGAITFGVLVFVSEHLVEVMHTANDTYEYCAYHESHGAEDLARVVALFGWISICDLVFMGVLLQAFIWRIVQVDNANHSNNETSGEITRRQSRAMFHLANKSLVIFLLTVVFSLCVMISSVLYQELNIYNVALQLDGMVNCLCLYACFTFGDALYGSCCGKCEDNMNGCLVACMKRCPRLAGAKKMDMIRQSIATATLGSIGSATSSHRSHSGGSSEMVTRTDDIVTTSVQTSTEGTSTNGEERTHA